MHRFQQIGSVLIALPVSWFLMQAVHEMGHVAGAWLTGGQVTQVVLHPLEISRTDVQPNPRPLVVVWAGPLVGAVLPLIVWLAMRAASAASQSTAEPFARFFAGFCLIANGAYIGFGSFGRIGDCGQMLRYGSPTWALWLFGAATIPAGLWLWHTLDRRRRKSR